MPEIKTLIALRKRVNQERFDKRTRTKLIVEDYDTMDTFTVRSVEMHDESNTAVIVVKKDQEPKR